MTNPSVEQLEWDHGKIIGGLKTDLSLSYGKLDFSIFLLNHRLYLQTLPYIRPSQIILTILTC